MKIKMLSQLAMTNGVEIGFGEEVVADDKKGVSLNTLCVLVSTGQAEIVEDKKKYFAKFLEEKAKADEKAKAEAEKKKGANDSKEVKALKAEIESLKKEVATLKDENELLKLEGK